MAVSSQFLADRRPPRPAAVAPQLAGPETDRWHQRPRRPPPRPLRAARQPFADHPARWPRISLRSCRYFALRRRRKSRSHACRRHQPAARQDARPRGPLSRYRHRHRIRQTARPPAIERSGPLRRASLRPSIRSRLSRNHRGEVFHGAWRVETQTQKPVGHLCLLPAEPDADHLPVAHALQYPGPRALDQQIRIHQFLRQLRRHAPENHRAARTWAP